MNDRLEFARPSLLVRKERKLLAGIFILGVLIRIVIALVLAVPHLQRDSYEYYYQADVLLRGGYRDYFPNGYPLIILMAKTVLAGYSQMLLLWLNIILSTFTIWFTWDIGKRIFPDPKVALVAAAIVAFFPPLLNFVRWIMSETPTIFFLLGAYFFYYRKRYWWCGLFFGLATVIRPNIAPVFMLLIVMELLVLRKLNYRLLLAALIPIMLVGSYCYWKTGKFSIEGNARINILYAVTASGHHIDFYMGVKHPEMNTEKKAGGMYLDHMKREPGVFIRQRLANMWELWGFYASDAEGGRSHVVRIVLGGCNFFLLAFGLFGWWKNRRNFAVSILMLPVLVVTAVCVVLVAIPRYAYPAHPFLILTGSWALVWLIGGLGRGRSYGRLDG